MFPPARELRCPLCARKIAEIRLIGLAVISVRCPRSRCGAICQFTLTDVETIVKTGAQAYNAASEAPRPL
jgi:phage FluMu protein Com